MTGTEPERELIRRALPFAPVALAAAVVVAFATSGAGAAWSAAIGIVVVTANLVASGLSLSWAARISPVAVYAVGLGGFVLRLIAIAVALVLLDGLAWFSPVAFLLSVMPATAALLALEMKVLAGRRFQADLWYFRERTT